MDEKLSVSEFLEKFDSLYESETGKCYIFSIFEDKNYFELYQQKDIFDNLSNKNICKLYNMLSLDARDRYYKYLQSTDVTNTTPDAAKDFIKSIRGQAVADALVIEQNLLDGGMCTRDWDAQQIRDISSIKQNPISMNYESSVWD